MHVDTYRSASGYEKFITVPAGTNIEKMAFPANLDPELRKISVHQLNFDIQVTDNRVAFDSADIIQQINAHGYAVHYATITVRVVST